MEGAQAPRFHHTARRRGCMAARGARPLVVRWVGALGCPSSLRRRNIKQSPQYGPHLLTVRKHGAAIMRASDDAATRNARRGWRNRVPAETGFASADAMQRYRCVPDLTWSQLSRLSSHATGHAVEDTASLTGRKFVAEKILMHCRPPKARPIRRGRGCVEYILLFAS